ncbi:Mitochondrial inner membrane protein oxa1 [Neopestalotiopsis sp. 37M]|nr:Mitochondrial inner membrane protein oxa1 [Neopestalotiopsis sp. 37M]
MATTDDPSSHLAESGVTIHSDSEQYSAGEEASTSRESSSSSTPMILYQPPTIWGLIRGTAINLLLPFVNGMMLGFGELFAHEAAFRLGWSGTKSISSWQTAARQYSQIQRLHRSSQPWSPSSGALRGHSSALPRLSSVSRNPIHLGAAAGASRSLSLWPFGSGQQVAESKSASPGASSATPTGVTNEATTSTSPLSSAEPHFAEQTTASPGVWNGSADPAASSFSPELFSNLESASILDIPEQIGYLKHLGLDFGWGPTAMCEWFLEHIYIYTGLPWWAAIAAAAFGVRLLWAYPTIIGQQHAAKLALLQKDPEFIKASAEAKQIMWDKDAPTMEKMKVQSRVQAITRRAGVSYARTFLPPLAIVPFSFGMFRLLRAMAALPVPSLETGGFAWITDLTVYDPTYILPLASAALSALTMVQHQKSNLNPTPQAVSMNKFMLFGLTPIMFLATMWFPAAVQWFFLVFAVSTTAQGTALLNPTIRRLVGLPPLPGKSTSISPAAVQYQAPSRGGIRGMMDGATKNMANLQKGIEDYTGGPAKAAVKKAQDYERRRAQEEREKSINRMLENQRKKMSRRD